MARMTIGEAVRYLDGVSFPSVNSGAAWLRVRAELVEAPPSAAPNRPIMPCEYCDPSTVHFPSIMKFCPYCGRDLRTAQ
jgi:hypothetical protein